MDSEVNVFDLAGNDGTFDPSPNNNETLDEVEATEVYDYQNLTKYASLGKGVSRGIIALGALTVTAGILMGTSSLSSLFGSSPSVNNIKILAVETEDSLSYSFSTSNESSNFLRFYLVKDKEEEKAFELDVTKSSDYEGVVKNLGYNVKVNYYFELWNNENFSEILAEGVVYTTQERIDP